ncbi:hypothetical protein LJC59_06360, partial [Desulfovibrio sp. OttesenSCG-928-A18]|nr:hypothetical protein [Desulfovibrio sp. OttesenSCG-928-A18]
MVNRQGRGLLVYTNRWARENSFWWRVLPLMRAKIHYSIRSFIRKKEIDSTIAAFQNTAIPPLFSRIEIETVNRCNGACEFCPVNRNEPQRPYARMTEDLFSNILGQLADLQYRAGLSLHSNNEPLLDKRLPEFAAQARARLPQAFIKMFTNGTLLSLDLFRTLLPSFDRIFINNYKDSPEMHPNVQEIHDYCKSPEGEKLIKNKTVVIQLRNPSVVLSSRGGNAPNRKAPVRPPSVNCIYPFRQFVIRPDGRASLCCNDALGQMTMGDLNA